jgi:hypothetical protein
MKENETLGERLVDSVKRDIHKMGDLGTTRSNKAMGSISPSSQWHCILQWNWSC